MSPDERIARLEARLERERATRMEAERLAESATRELYVTREQLRLVSQVAIAANESDDVRGALVAAMDAIRAHTRWPAARAEVLGADGHVEEVVLRGEVPADAVQTFELVISSRAGTPAARLEFFAALHSRPDGVLLEVVGHVRRQLERVVDRLHAEQALRDALAELERSNAELESFAYAASHDLREPLRTIGGFAQLLSRRSHERLGPEGQVFVDYIQDGVGRLQSIVDDLLALSRADRAEGRRDVVELADVADHALQGLRPVLEESGAEVEVGRLPRVVGDAGQLGQVLANLVANAVKFHGPGRPHVRVAAERAPEGWVVSVTDDGPGIPAEDRERVFEMFHRLPSGDAAPGSGLGLAICKRIVEHHGGRIWVEPGPGGAGSRFCVLLADREPVVDEPVAAPAVRAA